MTSWQRRLYGALHDFEQRFDTLKERLGTTFGSGGELTIISYVGYGSRERFFVHGRVLRDTGVSPATEHDSPWHNLLNMYRRMESDEVPGAIVRADYGTVVQEAQCDEEGFFNLWLEPGTQGIDEGLWHSVDLRLISPPAKDGAPVKATAEVAVPPMGASFAVISDIDDTVIKTYATEWLRMARLTFLGNARTRLPFPGVAQFYLALQQAGPTAAANPLFYLSSSPWNLYDLLCDFFDLQGIPRAPMFLRDWGVSKMEILPTDHSGHKLEVIEELMAFYGELPFILIGDSGQQDPEIYTEAVRRFGDRVLAVYIRDVSSETQRDESVRQLAREVEAAGSTLILAEDTATMAHHAAQQGWLSPQDVTAVEEAISKSMDMEQSPRDKSGAGGVLPSVGEES